MKSKSTSVKVVFPLRVNLDIIYYTIKGKIKKYEYRTANAMLKDFALVKINAVDTAKNMVEVNQDELSQLEQAVAEQMSTSLKKKRMMNMKASDTITTPAASGDDALLAGLPVDIDLDFELSDDSD